MGDAPRPGALAARDPRELLHAVVADVGESLDLWSVDLWVFSEDADTLECRAYWCREPSAVRASDCVGAVVGLDQSHDLRRLVLAAEVVERHLGDDLSPDDTAALTQAGFTSRIDVPLLAGAEVLGVLSLAERRAVRRLSPEERARLGTLARLAAAVLRATRLYEAETQRAERLTTLLVTGHGLSASLSAQEIVVAVRAEAARLIGGVACVAEVVLRQDDGTFVRVAPSGEAAGEAWRADALARQAADLGRPEQGRTADGRARLMLPLTTAGRAAGYLELTAPLRRRFRESEVGLASLLAGQTAAALDRARAYRSLQSRSATDTLTGLYSRWYFYERLYAEVARGPPLPSAGGADHLRAGRRGGAGPIARPGVPRRGTRRGGTTAADQPARQGRCRLSPRRRPVRAPAAEHRPWAGRRGTGRRAHPRPGGRRPVCRMMNLARSAGSR